MEKIMVENEKKLFKSVKNGDVDEVRRLIEAGTDVNARNKWREVPLHYASLRGYLEIASLLTKFGADVNVRDMWERSPLHYASQYGYLEVVKLLKEHGDEA